MAVVGTRPLWAMALLAMIGNPAPKPQTVSFLTGWMAHEGGGVTTENVCNYNPLNLADTSANCNHCNTLSSGFGVCSFGNQAQGLSATAQRLQGYPNVLQALKTNDTNALGMTGAMSPAVAGDLNVWVSGTRTTSPTAYTNAILAAAGSPGTWGQGTTNTGTTPSTPASSGSGTNPCDPPSGNCAPWDIGCMWNVLVNPIICMGERIGVFFIAIVLIILGFIFMAHDQVDKVAGAAKKYFTAGME